MQAKWFRNFWSNVARPFDYVQTAYGARHSSEFIWLVAGIVTDFFLICQFYQYWSNGLLRLNSNFVFTLMKKMRTMRKSVPTYSTCSFEFIWIFFFDDVFMCFWLFSQRAIRSCYQRAAFSRFHLAAEKEIVKQRGFCEEVDLLKSEKFLLTI